MIDDHRELLREALEAAAKALNDLWCPTCQPYSDTGDAHIQYCEKSARAAITAYLATSTMTTQDLLREALEALTPFAAQMRASGPTEEQHIRRARAAANKIRAALTEQNT